MRDSIVEVKNETRINTRGTIALAGFLFAFCIAAAGCSNSPSPGGNNNNNNNNNGSGNTPGVVGPAVGTIYVISTTEKDTTGAQLHPPVYDTARVVADTITFAGRTNVTQIRDTYYDPSLYPSPTVYTLTSYFGYDAGGDFYIYDTTYPYPGWHRYPTGSKTVVTEHYEPRPIGTDTLWGLTATANYTGMGTFTIGTQAFPTADVLEHTQDYLLLDHDIDLRYGASLKFYYKMIDTFTNQNQVGIGAINPIIYTRTVQPTD